MAFIVILIALLIERFFDWSHLRRWQWYNAYQGMVAKRVGNLSPYLILALTIIPLLVLVFVIQIILKSLLYGFPNLIFELMLLIYCLGPQNLWADAFACMNALAQGDMEFATEKLKLSFDVTNNKSSQALHYQLLERIFVEANRRVFAVVFWFAILGPFGAVIYRTIALSAYSIGLVNQETPQITQAARLIESVLDWLPVRLFTFIFALGGHFSKVLSCWRKKAILGLKTNEMLLTECGIAALGAEDNGKVLDDGSAEKSAISLLDRSFIIALVLEAIIVLISIT